MVSNYVCSYLTFLNIVFDIAGTD